MSEKPSIKERVEAARQRRIRLRLRRGKGENRSRVSGSISPRAVSGNYINVYDWTAYFFPYTYTLEVSASVSVNGSNSFLGGTEMTMQDGNGSALLATAGIDPASGATSVDLTASTGLVSSMPATVYSAVSGTVTTGGGTQSFHYYQTLYVSNADAPGVG